MMVMPAGMMLNPEFEKRKADLIAAREKYTLLLEEYSHLTGVVRTNLETEYMVKLGKKEHKLFLCQVEILRLKREISIFQSARNRKETISAGDVKKIIEQEFAEYQKEIEKQKEKLKKADTYFRAAFLSDDESRKLKKIYHEIVRKLHPDLNPDLPPAAAALWDRVQNAYQQNDWNELFLLSEMAEELLTEHKDYIDSINSMDFLLQELDKITQKTADLSKQIAETKERVPFSYEKLLNNPAQVTIKRHELENQIEILEERIRDLKQIRKEFGE